MSSLPPLRHQSHNHRSAASLGPKPLSNPANYSGNYKYDFSSFTTLELHDRLRELRDQQDAYHAIVDLVQHLITARGEKPSLRHFDALIRANASAEHGSAEVVEELLKEMDKEGIMGDGGLFQGVLMALAVHPNHLLRARVLEEVRERWISLSPTAQAYLVVGYLRDREYELAVKTWQDMRERSVQIPPWLYDTLVFTLAEAGELETALEILQTQADNPELNPLQPGSAEDVAKGVWPYFLDTAAANFFYEGVVYVWRKKAEIGYVRPSDGTLGNVLSTAALAGDSEMATHALKMLAERGGALGVSVYESLMESYCAAGDVENALRILGITEKSLKGTIGAVKLDEGSTRPLYLLLKEGGVLVIKEAWETLREIQAEGGETITAAVNVCIEAASMIGELDLAFQFYNEVRAATKYRNTEAAGKKVWRSKIRANKSTPHTTTNLRAEAIKAGEQDPTKLVHAQIAQSTINHLLQGCGKAPRSTFSRKEIKDKAMFLANEMVSLDLKPNELTYDRLILVCLDQKDYEDALKYVEEMQVLGWRRSLRIGTWHALCMRMAKDGDQRVREVMGWMKEDGQKTDGLEWKVHRDWENGWEGDIEYLARKDEKTWVKEDRADEGKADYAAIADAYGYVDVAEVGQEKDEEVPGVEDPAFTWATPTKTGQVFTAIPSEPAKAAAELITPPSLDVPEAQAKPANGEEGLPNVPIRRVSGPAFGPLAGSKSAAKRSALDEKLLHALSDQDMGDAWSNRRRKRSSN